MSIAHLATTRPSLLPELARAADDVAGLLGVPLGELPEAELGQTLTGLTQLASRAESLRLAVLAEAARRGVAQRTADTGTDAWAARLTGDTREVMRGGLLLAQDLTDRFHHTREAFAAGALTLAQVRVVVNACRQAPPAATTAQLAQAEEALVLTATGARRRCQRPMDPKRLRQTARRMFDVVDRDLADQHEARMLHREEKGAEATTFLQLFDNGNGTFSGKFCISEFHGHLFRQAIEQLTAPRRLGRDRDGALVEDPTVTTSNKFETDGAAFCEVLEHLPVDGWSAKNGVTLLITVELEKLLQQLSEAGSGVEGDTGSARLDTGTRVSAGLARRMACNGELVPAVLGTRSQPLDLGRGARLHSKAQRLALSITHDSCAIAGCRRPFSWCEIHHPHAWSRGGRTDLDNALPLCGHHHRRAHDDDFKLERHATGEWRFRPRPRSHRWSA